MPELPDITVYIEALQERLVGRRLIGAELRSPFLLRSVTPAITEFSGQRVTSFERLGKRIAMGFDDDLWLIVHLMIAGRLHWAADPMKRLSRQVAAIFEFENGRLWLTEAGTKKRASLHLARGRAALREHDRGGLEVLDVEFAPFCAALIRENHTLKRALTDPRILSGVGNAYSDEILHRAKLSPVLLTQKMSSEQLRSLYEATGSTLRDWTDKLRADSSGVFPERVTAFRDGMAVHGRYGKPCPQCGTTVQRIRYASNETNYCPRCQTGGRLLADRSLSRLLKRDWPRTVDELEKRKVHE
jgi:formamidopyrimidine-DNA glycosylase